MSTYSPTVKTGHTIHGTGILAVVGGCALLLGSACSRNEAPTTPAAVTQPRVEENSRGPVSVTFTLDPPVVRLDRDTLLVIRMTSPTNITLKLPPMENRVKGFSVSGSFDTPPSTSGGKLVRQRNVRLTPQASDEYRIAPMAVTWREPGTGLEQWFPTKPVVLASEPLVGGEPGKDLAAARAAVWIYPGLKGVAGYALAVLGLAALAYGAWRLLKKARRAVRLRRMSPRERALFELAELMARDLVGHDRVKDFYFELTLIVRLYIERAHAIRAPEQTTEEFLVIVSKDPRFTPAVARRLREFMQAADLVKYAGITPDRASVDASLATARNYIETDSSPEPQAPTPS